MDVHTHAHTYTHTAPVTPAFPNVEQSAITKHIHHTGMKKANGVAFLLHSTEHTSQGQIPGNGMDLGTGEDGNILQVNPICKVNSKLESLLKSIQNTKPLPSIS